MKTIIKYALLIWLCSLPVISGLKAQDSLRKTRIEELKKYRRDLYIQKLSLTPSEAEKFFPVFDEYELKLREAKKTFRVKWKGKKPEDLNEEEASQYLTDATKLREKELELFKSYSEKLKAIIPAKKIIILPRVTREVQQELIKKAREMGKNGGGMRRGPGGRMRPVPR